MQTARKPRTRYEACPLCEASFPVQPNGGLPKHRAFSGVGTCPVRLYRVIWVRDDVGTRGVHCPGPFSHEQACTVLRKLVPSAKRRDLIEEITDGPGEIARDLTGCDAN